MDYVLAVFLGAVFGAITGTAGTLFAYKLWNAKATMRSLLREFPEAERLL